MSERAIPEGQEEAMALHVVFGAGQVGSRVARALAARGEPVRVVRRSDREVGDGIEVVAGDARDPAFVRRVTADAAVIYHCINPQQYTAKAWREEFPRVGAALIDAAIASDARLVCLDNLYAYGPRPDALTEDTDLRPVGPKCEVRAEWAATLESARRERGLRYVVGRAGDFFGPGAEQAVLSAEVIRQLRAGSTTWLLGDPAAVHAFSYVPDVVEGLIALGRAPADQVEGRIFHLPVIQVPPGELHQRLSAALGVKGRYRSAGRTTLRLLSPFVPIFRELPETLYQWDRPFLVDDSRFRRAFPGIGTPLDRAVQETAATV
jgi:nucleoside-diphosphate-sugar epimerase